MARTDHSAGCFWVRNLYQSYESTAGAVATPVTLSAYTLANPRLENETAPKARVTLRFGSVRLHAPEV